MGRKSRITGMRVPHWAKHLNEFVNESVYGVEMVQVQVRIPEEIVKELDRWIAEGRFKSRSDAIKTILSFYEEREKTRVFYKMLVERSREAKEKPDLLIPLKELG